jgi:hypothetical protein
MKPLHLLLTVPFVGLLALHFVDQRRHKSELAELRSELGALSTPVDAPRPEAEARRGAPRLAAAPAAPKQVAPEPAPAADAPPNPPPMEVTVVRDRLEASFMEERADARWSGEARRTAETRIEAILPETSKLQSLECRNSMCRIETVHQGLDSLHQFVQGAFINSETKLWNGGFFSTELADPVDGKLVIVSYLAREGEALSPVAALP